MDYQKIPWSIEDTIDHLEVVKNILAAKLNTTNHEGKGEEDARELNYDFGRAINALKENQQYKKTGLNPNQVSETICELSATKRVLEHYQKLGTLEEVRDAVEKQNPKTPTYDGDGYAPDGSFVWDEWSCPRCGTRFEVEYEEHNYCPNCGQHILWEVEDER